VDYADGSVASLDHQGRLPGDAEFGRESRGWDEIRTLGRFKAEFARLNGPERRGRSFSDGRLDPERDTADLHEYHLSLGRSRS
jgi:hypothetical protein